MPNDKKAEPVYKQLGLYSGERYHSPDLLNIYATSAIISDRYLMFAFGVSNPYHIIISKNINIFEVINQKLDNKDKSL